MKATHLILAIALALGSTSAVPAANVSAAAPMPMDKMVAGAKTAADHQKLASMYEAEAAKARASAETHRKMAEAYRKAGGSWVEKLHFDQHCDGLVKSYTAAAEAYDALAKGEREMAKEMK